MSLHFGIQANGPAHLGCAFLQAEIKKQEQASQISSCLEQARCHFCWHSLANQVHGQVWQWAERCAPPCRSHGKQGGCVILLHCREQIVVNNNINCHTIEKYFNVVPLFDLQFFLNPCSAERQAIGSCCIFYGRAEFWFFRIRLTVLGYSGRMFLRLHQNLRTSICHSCFSFESLFYTKIEGVNFLLKNAWWKGDSLNRRLLSFIFQNKTRKTFNLVLEVKTLGRSVLLVVLI